MKFSARTPLVAAVVSLLGATVACSSSTSATPTANISGSASAAASGTFRVTITTCGEKVTFDQAPSRAVSNDINTFEDMAALGLEPRMVGDFGLDGFGPDGKAVPTAYESAFAQVKQTSPDYVSLEPLVGLKPDFLFAGWNYGLKVGSTLTPDNLAQYGIKTLVLAESCAHVQATKQAVSIDDTYSDITNLGAIFGVPAKAATLVSKMKSEIADVQKKVVSAAPKKVFLYDSGTDAPFTSPGLAMPDALISLAGGTNVFHDLKQTWTTVSWEQVVNSDPDCIIINDYGTPTAEAKKTFLQTSPITKDLRAVKAGCFITLGYGALTPSPLNADAVTTIAKAIHPELFA